MSNEKNPFKLSEDVIEFFVTVDGEKLKDEYWVKSIETVTELNKIAKATVSVFDGNPSKEEFKIIDENTGQFSPGKEVKIEIGYQSKKRPKTVFEGIILKTDITIKSRRHSNFTLHCVDKAYKMTTQRKSNYYLEKLDSDIMEELANQYDLEEVDIAATSYKHEEIIQYHSSDWDFIVARADANGMIVINEENKLKTTKPAVKGAEKIKIFHGTDIIESNLQLNAQHQLTSVKCKSWDGKKQELVEASSSEPEANEQGVIKGQALAAVVMDGEYELHLTGPLEQEELKIWADARLQKARLSWISGTITYQGNADVKLNQLVELIGASQYFNGKGYVSGIRHELSSGMWRTELTIGLKSGWFSETKANIEIPRAGGLLPGIGGLYNGKVKKIDQDPQGNTRVLVDIPMIKPPGEGDGVWARLANLYATKEAGSFFMPEIDDEVVLGFLNEDPRFPVILGMLYNEKSEAPYVPESENKTKAFVTREQLKIIFEEDKKNIIIETPAENRITLSEEKKKIIIEDENKNLIELSPDGILIKTDKDLTIDVGGKISIKGGKDISINTNRGSIKQTAREITAKAQGNLKLSGINSEVKGTGQLNLNGGIVRIN